MSVCRGCGNRVLWGQTEDGKKVPLDPVAPIYKLVKHDKVARVETGIYVSHWATCPEAYRKRTDDRLPPPQPHFSEPKEVNSDG